MKIKFKAVVSEVQDSKDYGQSISLCDLDTGGMVRISMGDARASVHNADIVNVDLDVKPAIIKGLMILRFQSGTFVKA